MKVIDLTHIINETMPVYPGTDRPKFLPANTQILMKKMDLKKRFYRCIRILVHTWIHQLIYMLGEQH